MSSLGDNLKHRKAAMISPLAFLLAACGGGGSSSESSTRDIDLNGSVSYTHLTLPTILRV